MNKLRLISGGGGSDAGEGQHLDEAQLLAKSKRLRKIRVVLLEWRRGSLPPLGVNVLGFAGLAFGSVLSFAWMANTFDISYNPLVTTLFAVVTGIAAGFYVNRHSGAPRSHVDHLDRLLAYYEPVSKDAYRSLQEKVKERGAMDSDLIEWWLELEGKAIQVAAGWRMPSEDRFLKNKV